MGYVAKSKLRRLREERGRAMGEETRETMEKAKLVRPEQEQEEKS